MRHIQDPIETDPRPLEEREDEMRRELRWEQFVAAVTTYKRDIGWGTVAMTAMDAMDGFTADQFGEDCRAFAEAEGWDGVLTAIARAMKEDAAEKRELMDRR